MKDNHFRYTAIDLFAGIGGIRLGFESARRFMTVFSPETDPFARDNFAFAASETSMAA